MSGNLTAGDRVIVYHGNLNEANAKLFIDALHDRESRSSHNSCPRSFRPARRWSSP
jgi:hypothetical protein